MISKYRLRSSAYLRADDNDDNKINPKRCIVLSVEGKTEISYFENLNKHLDNSIIKIEVLRHESISGNSDPGQIIELLNEYISVREGDILPEGLPEWFTEKYQKDTIRKYVDDNVELNSSLRKNIDNDLLNLGIDVKYRQYLSKYDSDADFFGVVIDRDKKSGGGHDLESLKYHLKFCNEHGFKCYFTNPCFEFWLLLHLRDVKKEYSDDVLAKIYENPKESSRHTHTSLIVSNIANHNKKISKNCFDKYYYPNISKAVEHSKDFSNSFPELFESLGTNIPELIYELGLL